MNMKLTGISHLRESSWMSRGPKVPPISISETKRGGYPFAGLEYRYDAEAVGLLVALDVTHALVEYLDIVVPGKVNEFLGVDVVDQALNTGPAVKDAHEEAEQGRALKHHQHQQDGRGKVLEKYAEVGRMEQGVTQQRRRRKHPCRRAGQWKCRRRAKKC